MQRWRALVVLAGVALGACGGGDDGGAERVDTTAATTTEPVATTDDATTTTVADAVGTASPVEQGVSARLGTSTDFTTIEGATEVKVGDLVSTDATGYGQVDYPDGSLTRLDVNTEFEVLALAEDAGVATTRTQLDAGRVWNRVEDLGDEGEFSVETNVAVATVQGTAFMVDCREPDACTFTVLEGSIELTLPDGTTILLEAPSSVRVDAAGAGPVAKVPADGAFGDPWALDNATRDVTAGFVTAGEMYQVHGVLYGSLNGQLSGTRTVTGFTCLSTPTCDGDDSVGNVAPRTYVFSIDCAGGYPCTGMVHTQYTVADVVTEKDVPVTFDGATYNWRLDYPSVQCTWDENGDGVIDGGRGALAVSTEWKLTPTAAEIVGGVWTVTAATIDAVSTNTVTENFAGCDPVNVRDSRQVAVATVTR